jgi:hypothetical protein
LVSHLLAVIERFQAAGTRFRSLRDPIDMISKVILRAFLSLHAYVRLV